MTSIAFINALRLLSEVIMAKLHWSLFYNELNSSQRHLYGNVPKDVHWMSYVYSNPLFDKALLYHHICDSTHCFNGVSYFRNRYNIKRFFRKITLLHYVWFSRFWQKVLFHLNSFNRIVHKRNIKMYSLNLTQVYLVCYNWRIWFHKNKLYIYND